MKPGAAGSGVGFTALPKMPQQAALQPLARPPGEDLTFHASSSPSSQCPWPQCPSLLARLGQLQTPWGFQKRVEQAGRAVHNSQSPALTMPCSIPVPITPSAEAVPPPPRTPSWAESQLGLSPPSAETTAPGQPWLPSLVLRSY